MKRPCFESISNKFSSVFANMKRPNGVSNMFYKPKTESDMRKMADNYLHGVIMEPELYVELPTASTLDYKRHFRNYGTIETKNIHSIQDLRAILSMTEYQKRLWDAKRGRTFFQEKLKDAAMVCSRRVKGIKRVADYLHHNEQFHPLEALQIILCAMRLHISLDDVGNLNVVKIKNTNQHNTMLIVDDLALMMRKYLRQGLSLKKAFIQGFIEHKSANQKKSAALIRSGWVRFHETSDSKGVYNLQVACVCTGWCIEYDFDQAKEYLSEGYFWIYFEEGIAEIAIYMNAADDDYLDMFGRGNNQKVKGKYKPIADLFLAEHFDRPLKNKVDYALSLNEQEESLLTDVLKSRLSGVLERSLHKYALLNLNSGEVTFKLPDFISSFVSHEISNQLREMVEMKDLIESNQDNCITINANIYVMSDCNWLSKIFSIKGNLDMLGLSNIHMPLLTFIGGSLDVRQSERLTFPKLTTVGDGIDTEGSKYLETPLLDGSKNANT